MTVDHHRQCIGPRQNALQHRIKRRGRPGVTFHETGMRHLAGHHAKIPRRRVQVMLRFRWNAPLPPAKMVEATVGADNVCYDTEQTLDPVAARKTRLPMLRGRTRL